MWRKFRIAVLLFVLATVAHRAWLETQDLQWQDSLYVAVYPVNADDSAQAAGYISVLSSDMLPEIAEYFAGEAASYGLPVRYPFQLRWGSTVTRLPPQPVAGSNVLQTVVWSLRFRWWAWRNSPPVSVPADIKLYLLYHDPAQHTVLPHSTALRKGRAGLVHLFADERHQRQNAVIIAHELLHTVGATDKYDLANNQPYFPDGYAEPEQQPLFPQHVAELMAGRIPLSEYRADIPGGLSDTLVGRRTAREIGWIKIKKE